MNTTVVCRGVRPATGNSKLCVVIASQDEREGARAIDLTAASDLTAEREQLRAQGIVLGGPLEPAPSLSTQSSLASPIEIIAQNEHGKEHRLTVDHLEEYSLSSVRKRGSFRIGQAEQSSEVDRGRHPGFARFPPRSLPRQLTIHGIGRRDIISK